MNPLHQRWLLHYINFSKNHQPIEGIGNAMVGVCNIECAIPIKKVCVNPNSSQIFYFFLMF